MENEPAAQVPGEPSAPIVPAPPEESYPFWSYADLAVFFGIALPCLIVGGAVVKVFVWALHLHVHTMAFELVPAQFAGYGLLFFVLYLLLKWHYGKPFWQSLRWVRTRPSAPKAMLYGFALAFIVAWVGAALRTPDIQTPMKDLLSDRSAVLLVGAFAVTLGPLCEELAFRGFLQPVLVRSFGAIAGVVLTAVPFGVLHLWEYGQSWRHVVLITIAGTGFGWMRHASGSTRAAAIMHAAFNFISLVAYFSPARNMPKTW